MKEKKKVFVGYVPKGVHIRESVDFWDTKTMMMFSKKQLREVQAQFPDEPQVKRTITVTWKDEEI